MLAWQGVCALATKTLAQTVDVSKTFDRDIQRLFFDSHKFFSGRLLNCPISIADLTSQMLIFRVSPGYLLCSVSLVRPGRASPVGCSNAGTISFFTQPGISGGIR